MKKFLSLFFLFLFLINMMLCIPTAPKIQSTESNSPIEAQSPWYLTPNLFMVFNPLNFARYPSETVLKINNKTGDFVDWTNGNKGNYPFSTFLDTGRNVTAITGAHGYYDDNWYKMTKNISFPVQLAEINRLLLNISLYAYTINSFCAFELHFYVNLYFSDGSHMMIGAYDTGNHEYFDMHGFWWRYPLTNPIAGINYTPACQFSPSDLQNKYLNQIEYILHVKCWEGGNYGLKIKVLSNYELYTITRSNCPQIERTWIIPVYKMEKGNDVWFYASMTGSIVNLQGSEGGTHNSFLTLGITSPLGIPRYYNMSWEYTSYNLDVYAVLVTGVTDLIEIGTYSMLVAIVMNTVHIGIINFTIQSFEMYAIGMAYPRSSYLSLYSTLDGMPLTSTNYKIYVGQDEERQLLDFKTYYYGDWTPIGLGNANYSFWDDYMYLQLGNNSGLQTQFKVLDPNTGARDIISRYDYNTLKFEIKPLNSFILGMQFNTPTEYYYPYNFTPAMVGYWWSITVPIFNFTKIAEIYHGYLNAIGFRVNFTQGTSGDFLLTNVRLSQYYTPVWNYQNVSASQLETHFGVINSTTINLRILNNQTLQLLPTTGQPMNIPVQASADDAYYYPYATLWDNSANLIYAYTYTPLTNYRAYLRFPVNTGIWNTSLHIYVNTVVNAGTIRIYLLNKDNCSAFPTGSGNENNYPNTSTYIDYAITTTGWKSINITSLVKAFIQRTNFTLGAINYLGLRIVGLYSAMINFRSFNYGGYTPFLQVYNLTHTTGYYISRIYDLGSALQYYYYTLHYAVGSLNASNEIILQYRSTANLAGWGAWSTYLMTNQTLNVWGNRYFQFKVSLQSVNDYAVKECYWVNLTYLLDNDIMEGYLVNPYRLCSPANRQVPTNLQFAEAWETLCITDYFNVVLYRQRIEWTAFIDIGLPVFTLTVVNDANISVIARIVRGYGVYIDMVLAPNTMVSIQALATNYALEIRDMNLNLLTITSISPYSKRMVTYIYTVNKTLTTPPATDLTLVYILIGVVLGFIGLNIATTVLQASHYRKKTEKMQRIRQAQEELGGQYVG